MRKRLSKHASQQHLVEATLTTIYQYGFQNATTARVAREAGLSAGNIHHQFGAKEELFSVAMRSLMSDISDAMVEQLADAATPLQRVQAILEANLSDQLFNRRICFVWLQFWAASLNEKSLARLERINAQRFHGNLLSALKRLVGEEHAQPLAHSLMAMVDGFWRLKAQAEPGPSAAQARECVFAFLDSRLSAIGVADGQKEGSPV